MLEDAQRQVNNFILQIIVEVSTAQVQEQAERLRQAELKLKEAEFMSKEKALESDR